LLLFNQCSTFTIEDHSLGAAVSDIYWSQIYKVAKARSTQSQRSKQLNWNRMAHVSILTKKNIQNTFLDVVVTHAISTQWFQSRECVPQFSFDGWSLHCVFLRAIVHIESKPIMHRMCVFYKESKPIILNSCAYTLSLIFVCLIWEFIIFHYTLWRRFGKKNKGYSLFRQSLSISAIEIFL
jgi:hypothetical protein